MNITQSPKIKEHEDKIKDLLKVYPEVYYGKAAIEEMRKYVKKDVKWKTANGYYNPPKHEVYIFKEDVPIEYVIGFLAHELRHSYQWIHKKKEFIFHKKWYELDDPDYRCRQTELDANEFAYHYCKDNDLGKKIINHYLKKKKKWILNRRIHNFFHIHSCP